MTVKNNKARARTFHYKANGLASKKVTIAGYTTVTLGDLVDANDVIWNAEDSKRKNANTKFKKTYTISWKVS